MENMAADLEYKAAVASNADKPKRAKKEKEPSDALHKVKLQLAEAKMALLAGYLAMWTCERTETRLRGSLCLFVSFFLVMSAVYRKDLGHSAACGELGHRGGALPGRVLPTPMLAAIYDALAPGPCHWESRIVEHLGVHARHRKTWSIEVDGEGADRLKTLFPGYWDQTQLSRFNRLIHRALGCGLQKQRRILNKRFMQDRDWRQAVDQQLLHSAEMTDRVYMAGLRNTLNPMQAHLYGWE